MVRSIGKIAVKLMLFALITGLPGAVQASGPAPIAGVWEGTLGTQKIRACFKEPDALNGFGIYFYNRHLRPIYLRELDNKPHTYVEGYPWEKDRPEWTFDKVHETEMTGRWVNGKQQFAVRLTRVGGRAPKGDDLPCSSSLFHGPRLQGIRVATIPASKDGVRYTRLVLEYPDHEPLSVETFALAGQTKALRQVSRTLREPLTGDPPEWHDCELVAAANNSNGGLSDQTEPRIMTRNWLTAARFVEDYCGGPHPNSSYIALTFDLRTGRQIDLSKWLNNRVRTLAFRRLLFANGGRDDEDCKEFVEDAVRSFSLEIELQKAGLAFTPSLPHVVQACGDKALIPFAKLAPYLNNEGRKNVAAFQAEVRAKR